LREAAPPFVRQSSLAILVLLFLSGCGFFRAPATIPLKFFIAANGWYRVPATDLRSAGADVGQIDPTTLQLIRADQEIAISVSGQGDDLAIEFYGQASDSTYSAFNVYWLRWGVERGKRIRPVAAPAGTDAPKESLEYWLRVATPAFYAPQIGNTGSQWFWQSLTAPMTSTIPITLANAMAAPARLAVNLWGSTDDPSVNPDHHLEVYFNETRVASEKWDGQGARTIQAQLPAAAVRAGANVMRIAAPGDTRAAAEIALVQSIQVNYTRRLVAENDALEFATDPGTFRVSGFKTDSIDLYDITNPLDPARVTNAKISARTVTFGAGESHRWLAVAQPAIKSPVRIEPASATNLRSPDRRGDYVIITHPDFVHALDPLVKHRQVSGLRVAVVTTNEVYDEFGSGMETPLAIRDFLTWARDNWAPRYVLLVGKASYDYRNYMNAPNKNLLPTFLVETPHLGEAASDNWFIADEKTAQPALAIGRIPAKTPDQVAHVVDKIIAYETEPLAEWRQRAILVADNKEPVFSQQADRLAGKLPQNVQTSKVYLAATGGDVNKTRADILSRWNTGAGWLTYIGHGSIDTWAEGPLFSAENLADVKNGNRLPILFTPTCLDGYFYHPQRDSLAEDLLFKTDGGIVAGLVPTGLSFPANQAQLMNWLFDELFQNSASTLGEAILHAKQKLKAESPDDREVLETFVLLGDPALQIRK
jgi:peptidase C25-like protein